VLKSRKRFEIEPQLLLYVNRNLSVIYQTTWFPMTLDELGHCSSHRILFEVKYVAMA